MKVNSNYADQIRQPCSSRCESTIVCNDDVPVRGLASSIAHGHLLDMSGITAKSLEATIVFPRDQVCTILAGIDSAKPEKPIRA
ncbi:MAG: hypothetical protein M0Z91_01375 [Actinomycetota bacterium]|nr:hypothetical protein [Actinomycetota bacterium]